jgi:glycosyltransferase involved in cell wall biosynthesis
MSTDGIVDMAEEYLQKKIDEKLRLRILQWDMFFRTQIHDALELKCERRLVVVEDDDALAYDPLKIAARDKDDKWDCESILSWLSIRKHIDIVFLQLPIQFYTIIQR